MIQVHLTRTIIDIHTFIRYLRERRMKQLKRLQLSQAAVTSETIAFLKELAIDIQDAANLDHIKL